MCVELLLLLLMFAALAALDLIDSLSSIYDSSPVSEHDSINAKLKAIANFLASYHRYMYLTTSCLISLTVTLAEYGLRREHYLNGPGTPGTRSKQSAQETDPTGWGAFTRRG